MNKDTSTHVKLVAILAVVVIAASLVTILRPSKKNADDFISNVFYSCNEGKSITADFYKGESRPALKADMPPIPGGRVDLKLSDGRKMTLPKTLSADGIRYADEDESFIFWSKGDGALVLENNVEKSYIGCVRVAPEPAGSDLSQVYSNGSGEFSIRLPSGYVVDENHKYEALGPNKEIYGTKFTIPSSMATGTNLSTDSYISIEEIPKVSDCSASLFTNLKFEVKKVSENGTEYSVATSNDAGLGNRYEETIYALSNTNPCVAVRYFVHYSVLENYPQGTVKQFDKQAIVNQFDQIRRTLVVNQ